MKTNSTIYILKNKKEIIQEYMSNSHTLEDFEIARWGSKESMMNRFYLAINTIVWTNIDKWLDIGCGSGNFFHVYDEIIDKDISRIGLDITPEMIKRSKNKFFKYDTIFIEGDFEKFLNDNKIYFDLITMIGVLQQCGVTPEKAFNVCYQKLNNKGILFFTTKNINWKAFKEKGMSPEQNHSWFDIGYLKYCLKEHGFKSINIKGFLPAENKIVKINDSHTIFCTAIKS